MPLHLKKDRDGPRRVSKLAERNSSPPCRTQLETVHASVRERVSEFVTRTLPSNTTRRLFGHPLAPAAELLLTASLPHTVFISQAFTWAQGDSVHLTKRTAQPLRSLEVTNGLTAVEHLLSSVRPYGSAAGIATGISKEVQLTSGLELSCPTVLSANR